MSETDDTIPESERPTLKFPVGEELLPLEEGSPQEVTDPLKSLGLESEMFVYTNPGPESLKDFEAPISDPIPEPPPEPKPQIYANPGPPPPPPPRVNPVPDVGPPPPPPTSPGLG